MRGTHAFAVLMVLAMAEGLRAADWPCQGADAGLSKYSSDNLPVEAPPHLRYVKRFTGKYAAYTGNYFYGCAVVTHGGKAAMIADDRADPPVSSRLTGMIFDWATGQTTSYFSTSYNLSEHNREIDSHHYTNPIIWHEDGRIYCRRGGDHGSTNVYLPDTDRWIRIYARRPSKHPYMEGIDANAFLTAYKDLLMWRYGHTMDSHEYLAGWISEAAFVNPNSSLEPVVLGQQQCLIGPSIPETPGADGLSGSTNRYVDMPKCAADVSVLAALADSTEPYPDNRKLWLQATDLVAGQTLWTRTWSSDSGGQAGFYTSRSDYWRFIATEGGHYVFFTRKPGEPATVRAVDLRTGEAAWDLAMQDPAERPLLAYSGGCVYVVGRTEQYKLDEATGQVLWRTTHSFPRDQGYVMYNHEHGSTYAVTRDPIFRPAVLTDDTLWFVDGDFTTSGLQADLLALRTSDGRVVRRIDLPAMYADNPDERLLVVNDLIVADGLLGVLVGVKSLSSPYPNTNNIDFQDLYVFGAIPGDVSADGRVNVIDLLAVANAFGRTAGEEGYNPAADLNQDDQVNAIDLLTIVRNFGR